MTLRPNRLPGEIPVSAGVGINENNKEDNVGGFVNQTDLQGETERALRAACCEGCKIKLPLDETGKYHPETDEYAEYECTYNPKLLPLFNAGMAGAYAAAAKRYEQLVNHGSDVGMPDVPTDPAYIAQQIRALTPADARQAQTDHVCQAISDFCLLTANRIGMELDSTKHETFGDAIQAAIASAEARARLEEAKEAFIRRYGIDNWDHVVATEYAFNECVVLDARRICHLEAAARTPDSTPKITMTHGGLPGTVSPSASGLIAQYEPPDSTKEPE